jgi:uncharacterized protein YprB with RNaseH-like and TPR domain
MPEESRTRKRVSYLQPRAAAPAPRPPAPGFPGWQREGEFLLSRRIRYHGGAVRPWPRAVAPEAREPEELLFFDTETTGLSGGAGSVIFLLGTAWCEAGDLVAEQLFLADFPGEADLLGRVKERFSRFGAFVSYNGKTFDSRLLATRFVMNRMEFAIGHQIDLLHLARRLWRPLTGDCTLKTVEREILGIQRGLDVAGEEIPGIYFRFLRSGEPGLLPVVFDHNLSDITSLTRMWDALGRLLEGDMEETRADEKALGSLLLDRESGKGLAVLHRAFRSGKKDAGAPLGLAYKRQGKWEKALEVWEAMAEDRSLSAAVELAKHHEHRGRDPEKALEVVERIFAWNLPLDRRTREEIQRRRERLRRKVLRLENLPQIDNPSRIH